MSDAQRGRARRFGAVIHLRSDKRDEYLSLHEHVWPAVEACLTRSHIHNYTIFLRGDSLFSYFEYTGDDYEADMAAIERDAETQRWWALTSPCQQRLPGTPDGEQWAQMTEIWHLE